MKVPRLLLCSATALLALTRVATAKQPPDPPASVAMVGGASKLTAQFPCSQNYLNTVDYFTYRLTRTDLPSGWLQVLDFSRNPGDPAAASYVAVAELAVTGATCAFDITQADIPGADNDRGMFQLRLLAVNSGGYYSDTWAPTDAAMGVPDAPTVTSAFGLPNMVTLAFSAPAINAAIGTTYTVRVYQGSSSGVATTFPQAPNPPLPNPGTFTLSPLPAGNYQLVVAADNANTAGGTGAASARTADIAVGPPPPPTSVFVANPAGGDTIVRVLVAAPPADVALGYRLHLLYYPGTIPADSSDDGQAAATEVTQAGLPRVFVPREAAAASGGDLAIPVDVGTLKCGGNSCGAGRYFLKNLQALARYTAAWEPTTDPIAAVAVAMEASGVRATLIASPMRTTEAPWDRFFYLGPPTPPAAGAVSVADVLSLAAGINVVIPAAAADNAYAYQLEMEQLLADGAGVALAPIFVYHDSRTLVPGASPTYKLHIAAADMLCGGATCGAGKFRLHRLSVLSWSTLTTAGSIDLDISFYVAAPPAPTSLTAALAAGVDELTLRCIYPEAKATTTATGFDLKLSPEASTTPAHTQQVALADVQFVSDDVPGSAAAFTVTLPSLPPGRYTAELATIFSGISTRAATSSAFAIGAPTAPGTMTIDDGPTALTVAFSLPSPAVYDTLWYRLYAAGTDASAATWMPLSAAQAAAGAFAVTPGTSGVYKVDMRAVVDGGTGAGEAVLTGSSLAYVGAPAAIAAPAVKALSPSSIELAFTGVANAVSYVLQVLSDGGGPVLDGSGNPVTAAPTCAVLDCTATLLATQLGKLPAGGLVLRFQVEARNPVGPTLSAASPPVFYGQMAVPAAAPELAWVDSATGGRLSFAALDPAPAGAAPQYLYALYDKAGALQRGPQLVPIGGGGGATWNAGAGRYEYGFNAPPIGKYTAVLFYQDAALGDSSRSPPSPPSPLAALGDLPAKPAQPALVGGATQLTVDFACPAEWGDIAGWTYTLVRMDLGPEVAVFSASVPRPASGPCTFTIQQSALPEGNQMGRFGISLTAFNGLHSLASEPSAGYAILGVPQQPMSCPVFGRGGELTVAITAPAINEALDTTYTVSVYFGGALAHTLPFPSASWVMTLGGLAAGTYHLEAVADNPNTAGGHSIQLPPSDIVIGFATAPAIQSATGSAAGATLRVGKPNFVDPGTAVAYTYQAFSDPAGMVPVGLQLGGPATSDAEFDLVVPWTAAARLSFRVTTSVGAAGTAAYIESAPSAPSPYIDVGVPDAATGLAVEYQSIYWMQLSFTGAAFATGYKMHVFDNAGRCLTDTLVPNCAGTVRCVLGFNLYILLGMPPRGGATITFKVESVGPYTIPGQVMSAASLLALWGGLARPPAPTLTWVGGAGYATLEIFKPEWLPVEANPQYFYSLYDSSGGGPVAGHTARQASITSGGGAGSPYVCILGGVPAGTYVATVYARDDALGGYATQSDWSFTSDPVAFGAPAVPDIIAAAGDAAGASLQFTTVAGTQFYEVAILHSDGSNDAPLVPTCKAGGGAEPAGCVAVSDGGGGAQTLTLPLSRFQTLGGAFRFRMRAVASSGEPGAWSGAEPAGAPVGVGTPLTWGPVAVASTSGGGCALQFDPVWQADSYVVEVLDQAGRVVATVPIPAEKLSTCGFKL